MERKNKKEENNEQINKEEIMEENTKNNENNNDANNIDEKTQEKLDKIIKKAKEKGKITYGELATELDDANPYQMEKVFDAMEKIGVDLLSDDFEKGTKKFETKSTKKAEKQKKTSFDIEKATEKSKENRKDFGTKKNKKRTRVKGA